MDESNGVTGSLHFRMPFSVLLIGRWKRAAAHLLFHRNARFIGIESWVLS